MPTYEYRCTAEGCRHDFEKFQRMSDEPGAECPSCGQAAERKLSGGAGLIFKGSGFYITDYRGDSYSKAAKADSDGGGSPKKSDEGAKKAPDTKSSESKGGSSSSAAA